jgi:hypothetical protein
MMMIIIIIIIIMITLWPQSVGELSRPSYCRLSAKLVPTFADRWRHVVSVTDPDSGHGVCYIQTSFSKPQVKYGRGSITQSGI